MGAALVSASCDQQGRGQWFEPLVGLPRPSDMKPVWSDAPGLPSSVSSAASSDSSGSKIKTFRFVTSPRQPSSRRRRSLLTSALALVMTAGGAQLALAANDGITLVAP